MVLRSKTFGLAATVLGAVWLFAYSSFAAPTPLPSDPGDDLLHIAKSLADIRQVDNPTTVGHLLQLNLILHDHFVSTFGVYAQSGACPAGAYYFMDNYYVDGANWFHTLPTGKSTMRLPNIAGDMGLPGDHTPGDPKFSYFVASDSEVANGCIGPGLGLIHASAGFDNIPSYACISIAQIKSVFPKIETLYDNAPDGRPYLEYLSSGQYRTNFGRITAVDTDHAYSGVGFVMTLPLMGSNAPPQPECLETMYVSASYKLDALHKPDVGE